MSSSNTDPLNGDQTLSLEASATGDGVSFTVYRHEDDRTGVVEEFWRTWAELGVDPDETELPRGTVSIVDPADGDVSITDPADVGEDL